MRKFLFSIVACGFVTSAISSEPYYEYESCTDYSQYGYTLCGLYRFYDGAAPSKEGCESYAAGLDYPTSVCSQGSGGWYLGSWSAAWLCNQGNGHCTDAEKPYRKTSIFAKYCQYPDGHQTENLNQRLCQGSTDSCCSVNDRFLPPPPSCPSEGQRGNPVNVLVGTKKEVIELLPASSLPALTATFDSTPFTAREPGALHPLLTLPPSFGKTWQSSMHHRLIAFNRSGTDHLARAIRGGQHWVGFKRDDQGNYSTPGATDWRLARLNGSGWRLIDTRAGVMEAYDTAWRQTNATSATGAKQVYTYSTSMIDGQAPVAGLLIDVTDQFGRAVKFFYELGSNGWGSRIYKIVGPDGQEVRIGYDGENNVSAVTWPDGKSRQFVYERPDLPWALTGSVDEIGRRYSTFGYDLQGRATSTEHAGGADKHSVSWTKAPNWGMNDTWDAALRVYWRDHHWTMPEGAQVRGPLGSDTTLGTSPVHGMPRLATSAQPGGSGCEASTSEQSFDSRGNVTSRLDFGDASTNRRRTCYAYAADRDVQTYRLEGLRESDVCPADLATYQVPGGLPADRAQRKVLIEWHPQWKFETRRAEPKRITTTVYNGQRDPIKNDGAGVICAPNAPALPDGSKIAVVCTRYEQSTDDETGNQGFAAPAKETRRWSYTYNQHGQVQTETDPRGKVTSYDYWADTSFTNDRGHWLGDLKKVTNALSQSTEHLEYNKRGQVLKTQYANGSQELREYHARGWLNKTTLVPAGGGGGQVTQYDYYDTGLLKKVTQPDGSFAKFTWDDAHRLTDVEDSVGNRVHYELDNAGNRTAEKFKDPQGKLAKTIARTFDALGRMSSSTGLQ